MVTIEGTGFSPEAAGNTVTFGGTAAEINSAEESTLRAIVPDLDPGPAQVAVTVGEATASGPNFSVERGTPGISAVAPDSGTVGTQVTISGMNFGPNASENSISFNGTQAPVSSASETELVTEVPQGATDGPVEVTVGQKSTTGPDFDVITEGTIEVVTATSGSDQDPDGYSASAGGSSTDVGTDDTVYLTGLEEGSYPVELTGLASNCSVDAANPRDVSVTACDTTSTSFSVSCKQVLNNQIAFASDRDGDLEIWRFLS